MENKQTNRFYMHPADAPYLLGVSLQYASRWVFRRVGLVLLLSYWTTKQVYRFRSRVTLVVFYSCVLSVFSISFCSSEKKWSRLIQKVEPSSLPSISPFNQCLQESISVCRCQLLGEVVGNPTGPATTVLLLEVGVCRPMSR